MQWHEEHAGEENLRLLDEDVARLARQAKFTLASLGVLFALGAGMIGYALHQEMSNAKSVAYVPQYEMNAHRR